jgi:glycosyltransferase involved in cell wall biosynthesis
MFVRNSFTHDTRVLKEARSLVCEGHEVEVVCLKSDGLPDYEIRKDKIVVRRIAKNWLFKKSHNKMKAPGRENETDSSIWGSTETHEDNAGRNHLYKIESYFLSRLMPSSHAKKTPRWLLYLSIFRVVVRQVFLKGGKLFLSKALHITQPGLFFTPIYLRFFWVGVKSMANVYHAHDLNTLLPCVLAARKTGGLVVYDSHELFSDRNTLASRTGRSSVIWLEAKLIRYTHRVITVCDSIADILCHRYRIERPVIIRNVQPYIPFHRTTRLRDLKELCGISQETCIAIYAGRITHGRGLETLIEASHYLHGVIIVLMGGGNPNYRLNIKSKIKECKAEDKVIVLPPVEPDRVHEYLCSADLGLMPTESVCLSYYLGVGNKLFHYLMAGLPVVVSNHPEKKKIVKQYDVGRTCNERDSRNTAQVIQELTDDIKLRRILSMNALKAGKTLCWENEEKKLIELYRNLKTK